MARSSSYVVFDSGLMMNTKYLTENVAYFLGGIFASEEQVIASSRKYRIAPVRYNYGAATELEIAQHFELVREIAEPVNGQTVMAENIRGTPLDSGKNRMPGFSTFFQVSSLEQLTDLIPSLESALLASPWSVHQAFLVGVFDGRSSPDINRQTHNVRYLSLDCITDEVGCFLDEMVDSVGLQHNYNTHRERREGGRPRNPQLRVGNVSEFMNRIGLISPRRVNLLHSAFIHNYGSVEIHDESTILPGLKTLFVR